MAALIAGNLFIHDGGHVSIDWQAATAALPSIIVAIFTENLLYAVMAGVAAVPLLIDFLFILLCAIDIILQV